MKTYLILDFSIKDLPAFMEYVEKIPAYLEKHSARYLVEGVIPEVLEGDWKPERIVILEFESAQDSDNFLNDPDVKQLFSIRRKHTTSNLIKVHGGSWRS